MKSSDCMRQLSVNRRLITDLHDKQNYQRGMVMMCYDGGKLGAARYYEKDADSLGRQIARLAALQRVLKEEIAANGWAVRNGCDGPW